MFLLLLLPVAMFADPWGKDAEMVPRIPAKTEKVEKCSTPLLGPMAEYVISVHQDVVSPADGPRSNYFPTSSQYMLDAIRKYGIFQGVPMGCDRLMRENEDVWVYTTFVDSRRNRVKYDPVK